MTWYEKLLIAVVCTLTFVAGFLSGARLALYMLTGY